MYYRFLVTTGTARSSLDARRKAVAGLWAQGIFKDIGGHWPADLCNWFDFACRSSAALRPIWFPLSWVKEREGPPLGRYVDAAPLTEGLYDRFLAGFTQEDAWSGFADLDDEPLSRDFIGRKWLVVVDIHY